MAALSGLRAEVNALCFRIQRRTRLRTESVPTRDGRQTRKPELPEAPNNQTRLPAPIPVTDNVAPKGPDSPTIIATLLDQAPQLPTEMPIVRQQSMPDTPQIVTASIDQTPPLQTEMPISQQPMGKNISRRSILIPEGLMSRRWLIWFTSATVFVLAFAAAFLFFR